MGQKAAKNISNGTDTMRCHTLKLSHLSTVKYMNVAMSPRKKAAMRMFAVSNFIKSFIIALLSFEFLDAALQITL